MSEFDEKIKECEINHPKNYIVLSRDGVIGVDRVEHFVLPCDLFRFLPL